jgi:hypothetical protein
MGWKRCEIAAQSLQSVALAVNLILSSNTDTTKDRQQRVPPMRGMKEEHRRDKSGDHQEAFI